MNDISLPEVPARTMHARFHKDANGSDRVEISMAGTKDTVVTEVTPDVMAQYREEWNAYCDGRPLTQRPGSPLTDIPGMNEDRLKHYLHMNVHTLEELAALNDIQCQGVGHGVMTERKTARTILTTRQAEKKDNFAKKMEQAMKTAQPVQDQQSDEKLDKLIAIGELTNQNILALIQALQPRKPGRPKKEEADGN